MRQMSKNWIKYLAVSFCILHAVPMTAMAAPITEKPIIQLFTKETSASLEGKQKISYKEVAISRVSNYVNVRAEANTTSDVVGKIYNNCAAKIIKTVDGEGGQWYQIESGNVTGYIKAEYFITGSEAETLAKKIGIEFARIKNTATLRLREQPSVESKTLTLLAEGAEYIVEAEEDGFAKISVDTDLVGYVSQDYIETWVVFDTAVTLEEEQAKKDEAERLKQEADEAIRQLAELKQAQAGSQSAENPTGSTQTGNEQTGSVQTGTQTGNEQMGSVQTGTQAGNEQTGAPTGSGLAEMPTGNGQSGIQTGNQLTEGQSAGDTSTGNGQSGEPTATQPTDSGQGQTITPPHGELDTGIHLNPPQNGGSSNIIEIDPSGQNHNSSTISQILAPGAAGQGSGSLDVSKVQTGTNPTTIISTAQSGSAGTGPSGVTVTPSDSKEVKQATRTAIVAYARQFLGNPYVYGGTSLTDGADCSGFVQSIYKHFDIATGRSSRDQAAKGKEIAVKDVQPGDLLFYASGDYINHVAMYIGGNQVIHASNSKTGIIISPANYRTPCKAVTFLN